MTRKHFKAIAAALANIEESKEKTALVKELGDVCRSMNERFNRKKFEGACYCDKVEAVRTVSCIPVNY